MYLFCQNINEDYNIKWFEKNMKIRNTYDDIDLMIVDLKQLIKFQEFERTYTSETAIQRQQSSINIEKVYRGCRMSVEEFIKLQKIVGNMIAFNTFVSTTIDRQIAMMYAGIGEDRPRLESVLFEIQTDSINQSTSYLANIKEFSPYTR